jgi:hypothetical protein
VALGARDVLAVSAFYRDAFRLPHVATHHFEDGTPRSVWLDLGGAILMVEHTEAPPGHVVGVGAGPFLLAFRVTPGERGAVEGWLAAHGSPVESRTAFTSYTRDPEGNRVAISHHPEPALAGP